MRVRKKGSAALMSQNGWNIALTASGEKSRSFTIYKKRVLEERLPNSGRNHAECLAKA